MYAAVTGDYYHLSLLNSVQYPVPMHGICDLCQVYKVTYTTVQFPCNAGGAVVQQCSVPGVLQLTIATGDPGIHERSSQLQWNWNRDYGYESMLCLT